MPNYRVSLRGSNFLFIVKGAKRKVGFRTARFIAAKNSELAELIALDMLSSDAELPDVLNEQGDPPLVEIDKVEMVATLEQDCGIEFYLEDD